MIPKDGENPEHHHQERFIKIREVCDITTLSRAQVYKKINQGKFPPPVPLGEESRAVGWVASEIFEWMRQQIQLRGNRYRKTLPEGPACNP